MSRSIQTIQNSIQQIVASQSSLSSLNLSNSQTSIYGLWENVMSVNQNIEETLWDLYSVMLDNIASNAPISTDNWVYTKVLEFQWDPSIPQSVSVDPSNNFTVGYNPVDLSKRIITQAAVITLPNRLVSVKVATGTPPAKLSAIQLASFIGYMDEITPAGVQYLPSSANADLLNIELDLFYNGQYSATIQTVVNAAIATFITNLPFNGIFKLSQFEQYLLAIPGVTDVDFKNISISPGPPIPVNYFYLVQNYTEVFPTYPLYAGYATLNTSTINFISS